MAVTVKRITLWRADVDNHPGVLARALEPLAQAGADLRLVMGYRLPHTPERAAIELYPVSGKRATAAAAEAGLAESRDIPCLLVEGDNRPRSEEHTSELQSQFHLVCRLLLEKKKKTTGT